jgi:hypothetical protein
LRLTAIVPLALPVAMRYGQPKHDAGIKQHMDAETVDVTAAPVPS